MKTIQKLPKLPIFRHEVSHKYYCEKSNKWLKWSTTAVCNELTEEAKFNIDRTRHIWQPRGETIHTCLEQKMLGSDDIDMGEYKEWVVSLFSHELFEHFEPMGVEYMMSNPEKDLGGQLDLIGYDTKAKKIRLIDLKTKCTSALKYDFKKRTGWREPYSTDKQLGCYIEMLKLNCDIEPDVCNTIWAYQGKCMLNEDQPVERCRDAWQEAWEKFEAKKELF